MAIEERPEGKLPCRQINCELVIRLRRGLPWDRTSFSEEEFRKHADDLMAFFQEEDITPVDALCLMKYVEARIWELRLLSN